MTELAQQQEHVERLSDEEAIDLRQYWRVVKSHKWSILGLALLAGLLAALVAYSMKPIYSSTATLLIEPDANKVVSIQDVYDIQNKREYFQTQYELLRYRTLTEKVIARLDLKNHPEFKHNTSVESPRFDWRQWIKQFLPQKKTVVVNAEEASHERLIADYSRRLSIAPVPGTHLVKITFESTDPKLAAQLANTLAEVYIENDMEARLEMTSKATSWLTERLEGLREKLRESERALQEYRERERLLDVGGGSADGGESTLRSVSTLTVKQLQNLSEKLVLAEQKRNDAEALLRQVRALKGKSIDDFDALPSVLQDTLVGSLKQAESDAKRRVSILAKRYGPKHPKMIQAKADLAEVRANVKGRIRSVIRGVEKKYQLAVSNERAIRRALEQAKGEMRSINRKSYQLSVLEREVESNRQLYNMFLDRFKETSETGGLEKVNARIADPAVPAIWPIKPKKTLIVLMATLIGGFIGILLAFLHDYLDNTVKSADDLEDRLQLPVLGLLPHLQIKKKKGETPLNYAREHRQSFFSESIRTIRTGILLSGLDDPYKVIVVTSSLPGEGKSTVSVNLAHSLGEMHKVLLIDGDLRRPTVGKAWGLEDNAKGLSDFVSGADRLSECIYQMEGGNVYVMPSGLVPPNPLELLSSKRFRDALETMGKTFDHIIIDSAPALAVSDSLVLSSYASGVVYVVKADTTPYPVSRDGIKRLRQANAHLIGGVLNDVPQSKKGGYGKYNYYYNGSYYGSYGYTSD